MVMKCENCHWEGEDQPLGYGAFPHCPTCGQSIKVYDKVGKKPMADDVPDIDTDKPEAEPEQPKEEPISAKIENAFDLNKDGKVDKKDKSLAARVLGMGRKSKRNKGKR